MDTLYYFKGFVPNFRMIWLFFCLIIQLFLTNGVGTVVCENNWWNIWTNKETNQCFTNKTRPPTVEVDPFNVTHHFIEQGYDHTKVPQDLEGFVLEIMHEAPFTFKADSHGELIALTYGLFNDVYLARYNKTKNVIVKFAKDTPLESVIEPAMIMKYLQDTVPIPKLIGLTSFKESLSIVQEYFPKSKRLSSFLKKSNTSSAHLTSITLQIASTIRQIHERFVLFNDLTPSNILLNFTNGKPVVKFADFSQATFKTGVQYIKTTNFTTELSPHVAPELHIIGFISPAIEVYSLGETFRRINVRLQSSVLNRVSCMCKQENPKDRPSARDVQFLLDIFLGNLKTTVHKLLVKSKTPKPAQFLFDRPFMQLSVPLISHTNLLRIRDEKGKNIWLRQNKFLKVFAAELYSRFVIVKTVKVDFEFTRQEALIHLIMNNTGTVPNFYGLFPTGQKMSSFGLVSDLYGKGVNLEQIIPNIANLTFEFQTAIVIQICDIVQKFHDRGFLINNIGLDNFLIDDDRKNANLRIIGLNSVSGLDGIIPKFIIDYLLSVESTAPEVGRDGRTSIKADSFSVGYALLELQLMDALKLQALLLYRDCLDKGVIHCPSLMQVKETFISFLKSREAPKDFS